MTSATAPELPAEIVRVRQFINTLDVEAGTDDLTSPGALVAWLAERGLVESAARATTRDLELARRLRDALRSAVATHHDGHDDTAALAELHEVAAAVPLRLGADASGPALVPASTGVRGALASLIADVAVARVTGTWTRLKICPADDCRWAFFDQSKNRSRRWCAMGVCGNRSKTKAYRARHSAD